MRSTQNLSDVANIIKQYKSKTKLAGSIADSLSYVAEYFTKDLENLVRVFNESEHIIKQLAKNNDIVNDVLYFVVNASIDTKEKSGRDVVKTLEKSFIKEML